MPVVRGFEFEVVAVDVGGSGGEPQLIHDDFPAFMVVAGVAAGGRLAWRQGWGGRVPAIGAAENGLREPARERLPRALSMFSRQFRLSWRAIRRSSRRSENVRRSRR